jgi:hypothetical protein
MVLSRPGGVAQMVECLSTMELSDFLLEIKTSVKKWYFTGTLETQIRNLASFNTHGCFVVLCVCVRVYLFGSIRA